ncbi:MAG TPA: alpha/beta hydrolase, partial [Verrucomicrobiae bacterium]|nr:alpha/beta hydrolase [Verrucomicrobiae bacterium]
FCAGCASFQRKLIYFPPVFDRATADQLGVSENLQRWNNAAGIPIGWKRTAAVEPAIGQLLVVHGNAGAAAQCGHYADVIQQVAPVDVFIAEYPGYADRPGAPSERTLEESADEAFQSLATNAPVYLVGESLGTGVACWLAGKHPDKIAGVVLLAPYNTLTDVAQEHMPLLPVHLLLVDRFPSEKYLRNYSGPISVLVAGKDQVVPERFGRRLYDGYTGPKRLWEFPEGDHGTVMEQPPEIWKQIIGFLQTNPQPKMRN